MRNYCSPSFLTCCKKFVKPPGYAVGKKVIEDPETLSSDMQFSSAEDATMKIAYYRDRLAVEKQHSKALEELILKMNLEGPEKRGRHLRCCFLC